MKNINHRKTYPKLVVRSILMTSCLGLATSSVLAETVEKKPGGVIDNEALDNGEADAQQTQAEKVHQIEGVGQDPNPDKWEIRSVLFRPPADHLFDNFPGTVDDYVDIIPRKIDGLDADATPEGPNEIRIIWLTKSQPVDADSFNLRAEGNLEPTTGGEPGSPPALHWAVSVTTPLLDIDTDIDRDGDVDDEDETNEESVGTIVIADKEDVYSDPDEPALRRQVVLRQEGSTAGMLVERSSAKLKLYDAETGGNELYGNDNEINLGAVLGDSSNL